MNWGFQEKRLLRRKYIELARRLGVTGSLNDDDELALRLLAIARVHLQAAKEEVRTWTPQECVAYLEQLAEERERKRRRSSNWDTNRLRAFVREMRADDSSQREMCTQLDARGIPTTKRASWSHLTWSKAFKSKEYRGSVCKWLSDSLRK